MKERIVRLLPHAAILICNMFIVFFAIDRVNTAMAFVDHPMTRGLLLILAIVNALNCLIALALEKAGPGSGTASRRPGGPARPSAPSRPRADGSTQSAGYRAGASPARRPGSGYR